MRNHTLSVHTLMDMNGFVLVSCEFWSDSCFGCDSLKETGETDVRNHTVWNINKKLNFVVLTKLRGGTRKE